MELSRFQKFRGTKKMHCKLNSWKEKAKERRHKNESFKKRIRELTKSRDNWKEKYKIAKLEKDSLKKELAKKNTTTTHKIKRHSYTSEEISFCVNLKEVGGCSYRSCLKVLELLLLLGILEFRKPSASSIRNWCIKLGYHKVHQKCKSPTSDWVLIVDESVSVGSEKILLLIGVNLSDYQFDGPLKMQQVEVLAIRIKRSWKAEEISEVVEQVLQRDYRFKYACSDNGNNLRKTLKMNNIIHIEDCGHCFGKILEKRYKKEDVYQEFSSKKSLFKKQNLLSQYAVFLPPQQRTKGRFMNLWSTCKWAKKLVSIAKAMADETTKKDTYEKIKWILDFEDFIDQLHKEQQLINRLNEILKTGGLSEKSIKTCEEAIQESGLKENFTKELQGYLERNFEKIQRQGRVICSSDIIESIFGKFKNHLSKNAMSGLTEGSLTIANYGKLTTPKSIQQPMEETRIVDILKWREENLPISMLRKKAAMFKNVG